MRSLRCALELVAGCFFGRMFCPFSGHGARNGGNSSYDVAS